MSNAKASETSGFLNGVYYTAEWLYAYTKKIAGNGVYPLELTPTANTGEMKIQHGTGFAWVEGCLYRNDTPFTIDIEQADGSLNRWDSLILRLNLSENEIYATVVKGEFATDPQKPAVTRNAEIYDLKICDIWVPAGCTSITQAQIYDTRMDADLCGVPFFPIEHVDTTQLYMQIQKDLEEFRANEQSDFAEWDAEQRANIARTLATLVSNVKDDAEGASSEVQTAASVATGQIAAYLAELQELVTGDTVGLLTAKIDTAQGMLDRLLERVTTTTAGDIARIFGTAEIVAGIFDPEAYPEQPGSATEEQIAAIFETANP